MCCFQWSLATLIVFMIAEMRRNFPFPFSLNDQTNLQGDFGAFPGGFVYLLNKCSEEERSDIPKYGFVLLNTFKKRQTIMVLVWCIICSFPGFGCSLWFQGPGPGPSASYNYCKSWMLQNPIGKVRVVKGIFVKRESAVLFLREAWNGQFISRGTWFAHQPSFLTLFIPEMRMEFSVIHIFYLICGDPGFFVPPLFGNLVHKQWRI